jgi:hypothetical protein
VVKCIHQLPSLPPQPSTNSRSCCTGNSFSWWLKVHLFIPMGLYKAAIEQVIQNHLLILQKPGGEIRAQYSILKNNRKSQHE